MSTRGTMGNYISMPNAADVAHRKMVEERQEVARHRQKIEQAQAQLQAQEARYQAQEAQYEARLQKLKMVEAGIERKVSEKMAKASADMEKTIQATRMLSDMLQESNDSLRFCGLENEKGSQWVLSLGNRIQRSTARVLTIIDAGDGGEGLLHIWTKDAVRFSNLPYAAKFISKYDSLK